MHFTSSIPTMILKISHFCHSLPCLEGFPEPSKPPFRNEVLTLGITCKLLGYDVLLPTKRKERMGQTMFNQVQSSVAATFDVTLPSNSRQRSNKNIKFTWQLQRFCQVTIPTTLQRKVLQPRIVKIIAHCCLFKIGRFPL